MTISTEDIINIKDSVTLDRRPVVDDVVEYLLDTLDQQDSLEYFFKDTYKKEEVKEILESALPPSSHTEGRKHFINDMIDLGESFFHATKSKHIRLQLEVFDTDMCRLFHEDKIRQRLLCTYLGPGTEWLDHSNVLRDGLRKGCNDNIVIDYQKVNKAQPFQVILLKGSLYGHDELGVVHRSPPIEKDRLTRVLFKVDEWTKKERPIPIHLTPIIGDL